MNRDALRNMPDVHRVNLDVPGPDPARAAPPAWTLDALGGRLVELSGDASGAPLTLVFRLVLEAQRRGEPAAWVGRRDSVFYPPDAADAGVDLAALAVVWTPNTLAAAGAADLLIRSGAFGLVALDLGAAARLPVAFQTRLAGLAKQHDAALVCLTEKDGERPSLGSLVSLRAHAVRVQRMDERFRCVARVLKDKRRGPGWQHAEVCRGPDGLH
jgi:recombination protein RecA